VIGDGGAMRPRCGGDPMSLTTEQEVLVDHVLHSTASSITLNETEVPIEIGHGNKRYLQFGTTTYEKATYTSPGKAGERVREGYEVTICVTTGRPWRLIVNGNEEKM
jgi:hypothetical protein